MYEVVLWSISLVTCVESRGGETRTRDARPSTGAEHTQYKSSHKSVTIVKRLIAKPKLHEHLCVRSNGFSGIAVRRIMWLLYHGLGVAAATVP